VFDGNKRIELLLTQRNGYCQKKRMNNGVEPSSVLMHLGLCYRPFVPFETNSESREPYLFKFKLLPGSDF
jgi:hypothetical protein